MHVRMFTGVYTCTLCSCEDQRRERKGSGRETTMAWGLSLFVHKNGVCVGPGPPNSILYQLTPTPRPHTHTRSRTQQRRKPTCTRCFSFFSSFHYCSFCCHEIYCIPSLDFFLKLLRVPQSQRKKMRTGMSAGMLFCVHDLLRDLLSPVSYCVCGLA